MSSKINEWLKYFDECPVECDGMTRIISTALVTQGVDHVVKNGYISNDSDMRIWHFWIELEDKKIIDLRAQMWLGSTAPHGLFENEGLSISYEDCGVVEGFTLSPLLYFILSGKELNEVPIFPSPSRNKYRSFKNGNMEP